MKKRRFRTLAIIIILVGMLPITAFASGPIDGSDPADATKVDDRMDPLTAEQRELKKAALEALATGKELGKTHEVAKGQYVELAREGEDPVWTVLG